MAAKAKANASARPNESVVQRKPTNEQLASKTLHDSCNHMTHDELYVVQCQHKMAACQGVLCDVVRWRDGEHVHLGHGVSQATPHII